MGDPLTLAVIQAVTPVAVAAMPFIWRQIKEGLRRVQTTRIAWDPSQATHLACIRTILDTLDRIPNLSWTEESHIQALLNQMKIKTESLNRMIENDGTLLRYIHRGKFAKTIQSVAVMMQLLETNVQVRRSATFFQSSANHDVNADRLDLNFYTRSRENLIRDLHDKLDGDDLKPVVVETRAHYEASIERSGTYRKILYDFQPEVGESGYPRTLTTSRGVRECIELLLKWLRDLKLMHETQNTGGSVLLGVAFYESFTEILPKVLMDHLVARRSRSTLHSRAAQQFSKNLRFFRSFSVSSTFRAIQGPDGLELEEEDKVLNVNLRQSEWVTWEDVQRMSLEVGTSSGNATRTASGRHIEQECLLCGLYFAGHSLDTEFARHWEACFTREGRSNSNSFRQSCCPVCDKGMDHLSEEERDLHVNTCLDRDQSGSGRGGGVLEW